MSIALTAEAACRDPLLGQQFSWMLDKQMLDERTAIIVFLMLERLRGPGSRYAPYIAALPKSFDTPLAYSDSELQELRGTTLHKAAAAVARKLQLTWSRLEPALSTLCRDLGLPAPSLEDLVWAHSVFWSRGQSLPVPEAGAASSAEAQRAGRMRTVEGLVPGLDFINHRPSPQCWWDVAAPAARPATAAAAAAAAEAPGSGGHSVRLQLHSCVPGAGPGAGKPARAAAGDELYISYGDKSNEELLLLYGFAEEANPNDFMMLALPLPPMGEWDDVMHARMQLLQAYGLRPQCFLPHPDAVARRMAAVGQAPAAGGQQQQQEPPGLVLPGDVLDALEVFVLNFQELSARSRALQDHMEGRREARAAGRAAAALPAQHSPSLDLGALGSRTPHMGLPELRAHLHTMGLRMATLTTFIRLLEVKVLELESEEEGTGPLERDELQLQSIKAAAAASAGGSKRAGAQGAPGAPAPAERRRHACLVYRSGQKRLARAWLVRAKAELQGLLRVMAGMQDRIAALERAR